MEKVADWFVKAWEWIYDFFEPLRKFAENFNEFAKPFRQFIAENVRNPFLWVGIIVVALVIFELVYQALNRK